MKQTLESLIKAYKAIITIRQVEDTEENHVKQGKAFFYMPSKGHEATIALNPSLIKEDYLACHYRDKGLMIARGAKPYDFFSTMFCKAESDSAGRQMSAFLHNRELNMLSLSGPVTNSALHACGIAAELKRSENYSEKRPIAYCGLGDGMTQEGEFYEAVLFAMMHRLPVLFVVQDNGYAISTKTKGKTFFSTEQGDETSFCGVPLERLDGTNFDGLQDSFSIIVERMRNRSVGTEGIVPAIVILKTERLSSHTNADDHTVYRSKEELENAAKNNDILPKLEKQLLEMGVTNEKLESIQKEVALTIAKDLEEAFKGAEPTAVHNAKLPCDFNQIGKKEITLNDKTKEKYASSNELTMNEAINAVLLNRLASDKRVSLFGEDIEDPKGDVFGVTKGLSTAFPSQVQNAPLAEATIAGVSVGKALVGGKPVGFFQFADFMPPAMNQLFSEVGNMYWRTNGAWQCPTIFMVSCGAYRPGLGPFHASTLEQMILQIPGIDVFMPSNATEAAKFLNTAFESNRPTVFFYPKNCLNAKALATSLDSITHCANPAKLEKVTSGIDITLAGWGNAIGLLTSASEIIEKSGKKAEILNLPSLSPWDIDGVVESVRKTGKLLVVQENNISCSFASEVTSTVTEYFSKNESLEQPIVRRLSRGDTFVPFHYENQLEVLPSVTSVVETAVEMIGGNIEWKEAGSTSDSENTIVKASGTSPSDEIVTVVEWLVKVGDTINQGDIIANMEANKAAFEFASPVSGKITEIFVEDGDSADVGENLFSVEGGNNQDSATPVTREIVKEAIITWKKAIAKTASSDTTEKADIGIAGLTHVTGANKVLSTDLDAKYGWDSSEKKNGIKERYWIKEGEDAVTLGFTAAKNLLQKLKLSITDIDSIICATGSPVNISPSNACMILNKLAQDEEKMSTATAFDFSAACSGYIYGLQMAWDFVNAKPNARVLLITAEVLTPQLEEGEIGTAPIFSDAATASIICSSKNAKLEAIIERPQTSTLAEDGSILKIPRDVTNPIFMDGPAVFLAAVRGMSDSLRLTCEENNISSNDIDLVVPHQANQRIIDAVRKKMKISEEKVYSNIAEYGNTSSCTIPIALDLIFKGDAKGNIALCAFGAGFTIGSCLLRR